MGKYDNRLLALDKKFSNGDNDFSKGAPPNDNSYSNRIVALDKQFSNIVEKVSPQKGFIGKSIEDLQQRGQNIKDILLDKAPGASEQSLGSDVLQFTGNVAGGVADIGGEAIVSGLKTAAKAIPQPVKDLASDIGENILESDIGKFGVRTLLKGVEQYNKFKTNYPVAARNLESVVNIAALATPVKARPGTKIATKSKFGKLGEKLGKLSEKILPEKITPKVTKTMTADEVRSIASKKYLEAAQKGGVIKAQRFDQYLDDIIQLEPQTKFGKTVAGKDTLSSQLIDRFDSLRGSDMTLNDFQEVDQVLTDLMYDNVMKTGKFNQEGRKLHLIQDKLRDMVDNVSDVDVLNKEGFESLKEARTLWHRQAKLREVETIIDKAQFYDQPATAIRSAFRSLVANKKRLKGYTASEISAIRKAAKLGIVSEGLRALGSRLTSIGVGVGTFTGNVNPLATGAVLAGGSVARRAGLALQTRKANRVLEAILQGNVKKMPVNNIVKNKMASLGGTSLNNIAKTLNFIDDKIVKTNNIGLIKELRGDRIALLKTLDILNDVSEEER